MSGRLSDSFVLHEPAGGVVGGLVALIIVICIAVSLWWRKRHIHGFKPLVRMPFMATDSFRVKARAALQYLLCIFCNASVYQESAAEQADNLVAGLASLAADIAPAHQNGH